MLGLKLLDYTVLRVPYGSVSASSGTGAEPLYFRKANVSAGSRFSLEVPPWWRMKSHNARELNIVTYGVAVTCRNEFSPSRSLALFSQPEPPIKPDVGKGKARPTSMGMSSGTAGGGDGGGGGPPGAASSLLGRVAIPLRRPPVESSAAAGVRG